MAKDDEEAMNLNDAVNEAKFAIEYISAKSDAKHRSLIGLFNDPVEDNIRILNEYLIEEGHDTYLINCSNYRCMIRNIKNTELFICGSGGVNCSGKSMPRRLNYRLPKAAKWVDTWHGVSIEWPSV